MLCDLTTHLIGSTAFSAEYLCYQCVSSSDDQEDCDKSDLEKLKPFIKACPVLEEGSYKGSKAKGCRKIIQTVESKRSIIRECAYSGAVVDGQKKTGNWGINMYYYQCENTVKRRLLTLNVNRVKLRHSHNKSPISA
ncbi:unnamed protein product [Angiostrongylus costaricensis]|uniref:Protein quiver n=1 Tax=Angiostrongylus costaricensis TaxID=334426 RepID=A0A3P7IBJ6_ANGCS|nr:unnamed protein product [Angiostrongylus costaricensis]